MSTPTLLGVPLKWISLITLIIQNSALVLVMRYSRTLSGPPYLPATAVVVSEFIKLFVCLLVHIHAESKAHRITTFKILNDVFGPDSNWLQMTVPALLYFIQNNLQYVAVTLLDAATFQVTYQFKIITTALFSVLLLKRTLSSQKWFALVLLTAGIAIVQFPSGSVEKDISSSDRFWGLLAVAAACLLSGLAGVWFEKVLKGTNKSLFLRNVQLSFFSAVPGLIFGVYIANGKSVAENGFFYGYNKWTWAAITCQAVGGLIVAVVVKYADNILKGFATSLAIILSSLASVFIFDFQLSFLFCIGAIIVLYATHLYGLPDKPVRSLPDIPEVDDMDKSQLLPK
ncbi:nucleotide-sugar transporter-domain-containing protein [Globomyces pollinis-pini]|nr:nucleotide-sugar transporter-domain-containing protein [Globomyces pollinis-pini]